LVLTKSPLQPERNKAAETAVIDKYLNPFIVFLWGN